MNPGNTPLGTEPISCTRLSCLPSWGRAEGYHLVLICLTSYLSTHIVLIFAEIEYLNSLLCKIKFCKVQYSLRFSMSVCLSVLSFCVYNNFLVYSIAKTILPGLSQHLPSTFLTSIPLFLLLLGAFRKTRWSPCLFFYSIFPNDETSCVFHFPLLH